VSPRLRPEPVEGAADTLTLGEATFDAGTGALLRIGDLAVGAPEITLWRAPTENDSLSTGGSYELGDAVTTRGRGVPGPSSAKRWRAIGLDRLHTRVTGVEAHDGGITVTQRIAAAGHSRALLATLRWTWAHGLRLDLTAEPVGDWPTTWPRAGVHFALPKGYERAAWFGTGPAENYSDSRTAARVARFDAPIDELGVAYAVPQETGHRADLRELTITGSYLPTLTVGTDEAAGRRPGFTLSRYSAEELAAARHPHELPVPGATHLYLDAFQHGLGSRSCGPDVTAEHQLWPRTFALSVQLNVAG
jgi:beta-galactosidase